MNEEQLMFEDALRRFLVETVSLDRLRAFAGSGKAFDEEVWQGLVRLGVPGLMVPQEYGGSGLGMMEAGIAAEQIGYAAAPVPFMGAVAMATQALLLSGSEAQRREWLPGIASGKVRIAVGFASALTGQTGNGSATLEGGKLSAQIDAVLEADGATHLLVYLPDGRAALVEASSARRETHDSVDATRRISRIVTLGATAQLLEGKRGEETDHARQVLDAGRLALACDTLGASQALLDKSIAYAKEREQFGRPIGSFQGVKYMCADMVTQLEPCRALVWHAAMLRDAGSDEARVAALQAKAHVGDVSREVSRTAIELHGGVGFTDMLGLPFWFRRIAGNRQMLGGPERCRQEAAQAQGWSE
ncbi:MAG: acyl-CoA dehydrogenase family protein [Pseudomonadota bacterium]